MSYSDDEDDFLSADEDGFDDVKTEQIKRERSSSTCAIKAGSKSEDPPISVKSTATLVPECVVKDEQLVDIVNPPKESSSLQSNEVSEPSRSLEDVKNQESQKSGLASTDKTALVNSKSDDEGDDSEEEALAQRLREQALRISEKFAVQKTQKPLEKHASAPPPEENPIGFTVDTPLYPDLKDSSTEIGHPSIEHTKANQETVIVEPVADGTSSTSGQSKYGWRLPVNVKPEGKPLSGTDSKLEQTKAALDRLSEKFSQSDKNLFGQVVNDVRNVSIKVADKGQSSDDKGSSAVPLISDLGQSLGSWNWDSASKFLESASRVSTQMGSVLSTVASVPQQLQTAKIQKPAEGDSQRPEQVDKSQEIKTDSMPAPVTGEALVDMTLGTMESLGKRAFGAMTERDESGSIQIKGLGRPWEHLLKLTKPQESVASGGESREPSDTFKEPDSRRDSRGEEYVIQSTKKRSDDADLSSGGSSSLKNRRRRPANCDNDEVD